MNALIIGYGRAGKRHGQILDELGIDWMFIDPYIDIHPKKTYWKNTFDFAVICTPPGLHLSQIWQCLEAGLPVLCEKPLCGLGQLIEAAPLLTHSNTDKVMIAYNWRFNPAVKEAKKQVAGSTIRLLESVQYRDLPEWGLLLDHCSHDLDILSFLYDGDIEVKSVAHYKSELGEAWTIITDKGTIEEKVTRYTCPRRAFLRWGFGEEESVSLDPDPVMFTDMYQAFLSGNYSPGLKEAIKTQRLLEKCMELSNAHH